MAIVGCLSSVQGEWQLSRATEPARNRNADEIAADERTQGILLRRTGKDRVNVLAVEGSARLPIASVLRQTQNRDREGAAKIATSQK